MVDVVRMDMAGLINDDDFDIPDGVDDLSDLVDDENDLREYFDNMEEDEYGEY